MATQQEDRAISRLRITAALTCVAIAALPVGAAAADRGDGSTPGRSGEVPGQVKQEQGTQAAQPAAPPEHAPGTPVRSHGTKASHGAKTSHGPNASHGATTSQGARSSHRGAGSPHAAGPHPGAAASRPAPNTHAKAGKTTICHATGSATNPYVTITISDNALPAHRRHQDGRDIVPAPAVGCPKGATETTTPAPTLAPGETPPPIGETPAPTAGAGPAPMVAPLSDYGSTPPQEGESRPAVLGESVSSPAAASPVSATSPAASPSGGSGPQVLGETASSGSAPATEAGSPASGSLPFTGWNAALAALVAAALLLTGVAARRAATHRH